MKHGNSNYLQLSRSIFTEKYKTLSLNAKWLFVVLNELEQRYTGNEKNYFFRSNEELAKDCGFSLAGLKRAKAELLKTDLVQTWQSHFVDSETGVKSSVHVTCYRVRK